jgi:hypothetical protein
MLRQFSSLVTTCFGDWKKEVFVKLGTSGVSAVVMLAKLRVEAFKFVPNMRLPDLDVAEEGLTYACLISPLSSGF